MGYLLIYRLLIVIAVIYRLLIVISYDLQAIERDNL